MPCTGSKSQKSAKHHHMANIMICISSPKLMTWHSKGIPIPSNISHLSCNYKQIMVQCCIQTIRMHGLQVQHIDTSLPCCGHAQTNWNWVIQCMTCSFSEWCRVLMTHDYICRQGQTIPYASRAPDEAHLINLGIFSLFTVLPGNVPAWCLQSSCSHAQHIMRRNVSL